MKKSLAFIYGIICYGVFLETFLYAIGFVGNLLVPKTIDNGLPGKGMSGVFIDVLLLTIFALQHSIMARPAFKKWWTKIIVPEIERSTYVLLASLALILLFWQWRCFNEIIWKADNPVVQGTLTILYFTGWIIVLLSTFMINHFDLFGLKQVFYYFKNKPHDDPEFKTNWLYRIVRHPLMLGFLIAFWATPLMTLGHLIFSTVTTIYILVAIKFLEERDLEKSIGQKYTAYKKEVPMLIPFTK
ncbi:hypothetical protein AHMF7605_18480 [Adhaeribacter arboris]|uniref:methanethiol S-methyltransferase n=1 Tax=Adhaeribacter arboris TaxID=2072846 RepID=A0A2T2YIM1_9BACT|nr:methanethiol S-methyltransferase [Adhaeribacter arboris]PSR55351.1 hypothetical protein AHMF7605_18480 [Adhaeribacter arboris]